MTIVCQFLPKSGSTVKVLPELRSFGIFAVGIIEEILILNIKLGKHFFGSYTK